MRIDRRILSDNFKKRVNNAERKATLIEKNQNRIISRIKTFKIFNLHLKPECFIILILQNLTLSLFF